MSRRGRAIAGTVGGLVVVAIGISAVIAWGVSRTTATAVPTATPSTSASEDPGAVETPSATPTAQPTPTPSPSTTAPTNGVATVGVVLVYAQWNTAKKQIDFSGFTGGVVESDGTCTASATGPAGVVTAKAAAVASATSTQCLPLSISGRALRPGSYTVKLSYSSPTAQGVSQSAKVVVP